MPAVGHSVNANYDDGTADALKFTTHFVADHVEAEYHAVTASFEDYMCYSQSEDRVVVVVGKRKAHRMCTASWLCDCAFVLSNTLPCRHAIAALKTTHSSVTISPLKGIDQRYMCRVHELPRSSPFIIHARFRHRIRTDWQYARSVAQRMTVQMPKIQKDHIMVKICANEIQVTFSATSPAS